MLDIPLDVIGAKHTVVSLVADQPSSSPSKALSSVVSTVYVNFASWDCNSELSTRHLCSYNIDDI